MMMTMWLALRRISLARFEKKNKRANVFEHALLGMMLMTAFVVSGQETRPEAPVKTNGADSVAAVLRGETEEERMYWLRRRAFVESVFEQATFSFGDSTLSFHFALTAGQLGLDKQALSKISPRQDYIGDRLRGQQSGSQALFNVGDLIGKGLKYLAGKVGASKGVVSPWTILPSETEIRVMNVLWQKGEVTSANIYAQLDSAKLHYKEVNTILENMVGRGLVERTQVSPSNEFTIWGAFAIEMSGLNAKNREYVYRPRASRELMTTYLDASAFARPQPQSPTEIMMQQHLRKLLALIANESAGL
ncbi:MAG: BlaI/MecI/CopY family transcriptional regulator [candidate division KSB1 bacterium]